MRPELLAFVRKVQGLNGPDKYVNIFWMKVLVSFINRAKLGKEKPKVFLLLHPAGSQYPIEMEEDVRIRVLEAVENGNIDRELFSEAQNIVFLRIKTFIFPLFKDSQEYSDAFLEYERESV